VWIKTEGLLARVFQHEIDQLNGILFIDRAESPDRIRRTVPLESAKREDTKAKVPL
jgi:peptide deformylase